MNVLYFATLSICWVAHCESRRSLKKEDALAFLGRKLLHTGHSQCSDQYYCSMHMNECSKEEAREDVCDGHCSYFQTCIFSISNPLYYPHDCTTMIFECQKLDPFRNGRGSFAFIMILTIISACLIVTVIILCCQKYKTPQTTVPITYSTNMIGQNGYSTQEAPVLYIRERYPVVGRQIPGPSGSQFTSPTGIDRPPGYYEGEGTKRPELSEQRANEYNSEVPVAATYVPNLPPIQSSFVSPH